MPTPQHTILLYADIVGYTALLKAPGKEATMKLEQFREVMRQHTQEYGGTVLQLQQDYCMASFADATSALTGAQAMQQAFMDERQVPVRIGLHAGPIIREGSNVFGEGTVVLRQIERVAVAGSIVMSQTIQDQITDEQSFPIIPLGAYQFKNVAAPQQLFALGSPGLTIPEKRVDSQQEAQPAQKKKWTQAIQLFAGYLVAAWTLLQFIDWILTRYQLSPYWTDISLWIFIGIIPSLLIYLLHRERFHQRRLLLREKIVIPLNLLLVFGSLTAVYGGADLGAITKSVTFTDENGQQITQTVVKPEFIKEVNIFEFEQLAGSDSTEWLDKGLQRTLRDDIGQDKYVSAISAPPVTGETEKIDVTASLNGAHYIDGTYRVSATGYEVSPRLKDKRNGEVVAQKSFRGGDVLALIDSMSVFLRREMGLTPAQMRQSVDLDVKDFKSSHLEAIRYYDQHTAIGYEKALELDSTMAMAAALHARYFYNAPRGQFEAKHSIAQAMRHRKKLPSSMQIAIRLRNYILGGEWDKAEQLIQLQLELNPSDPNVAIAALMFYTNSGQLEKANQAATYLYETAGLNVAKLYELFFGIQLEKTDWVIREAKRLLAEFPKDLSYLSILAEAYIHEQNFTQARQTIERMSLLKPEAEEALGLWLDAIDYMEANPDYVADLHDLEGDFRHQGDEGISHLDVRNMGLYGRTVNTPGWYFHPRGKDSIVHGDHNEAFREWNFFRGESGEVYRITEGTYNYWKQDSAIWTAEELLRNKDYAAARTAYQKAYVNHPEHFYLADALSHLAYLEQTPPADLQELYQQYAGQYGKVRIWVEDGQLWYKRPGLARRILRPVSDREFITLFGYSYKYGFRVAGGEVAGMYMYQYNNEKQAFEIDEDWDYPRTGSLE